MINFKRILVSVLCLISSFSVFAQNKDVKLPASWYNLDLLQSGYFGISTERAYKELLSGKQSKEKVIVAVIDGGVDIQHEDLKEVIWTNVKEIPGNGIDDDGNGYIDDVNGWNFIGSSIGTLAYDNLELIRIRKTLLPKYISTTNLTVLDSTSKEEFELYKRVTKEFGEMYDNAHASFGFVTTVKSILDSIAVRSSKLVPNLNDVEQYKPDTEEEPYIKFIRRGIRESGSIEKFYKEMKDTYKQYDIMLKYNLNMDYDERKELVGDNYADANEKSYGNNDVKGPNADHGSHVSGIIAASRANLVGIDGIADNVRIMPIRVVPEGDERDKDVANGIRYAVDNGARIINMSFGKGFKWNKQVVDDAVRYAEKKGVLIVHAAGNNNEDIDLVENYPNKYFDTPEAIAYKKEHKPRQPKFPFLINRNEVSPGQGISSVPTRQITPKPVPADTAKFKLPHATNWIEVGASAYKDDASLKTSFSNYGKYMVDVFAPGFMINSTVSGSKYEEFDGTSMAAPVVSGVAALILAYYPRLQPAQVRDIIIKSVTKVSHKVRLVNSKGEGIRVNFADLCISGGIVNAYEALKLAGSSSYK